MNKMQQRQTYCGLIYALMTAVLLAPVLQSAETSGAPTARVKPAIQMASPFTDHAILQREMPVPVWGWSQPGAKMTVEFQGQKKIAVAGSDGKWSVALDPLKASAEPAEMIVCDEEGNRVTLKDILVGEVWICSGQSNMQYGWGKESHVMLNWGGDTNLAALVPMARKQPIRSYLVETDVAFTPDKTCKGSWSTDVSGSAVAFGFSYHLYQKVQVPVGVIVTCWGSSSIEGWMPRELTAELPHFKTIMDSFDGSSNIQQRVSAAMAKGIRHGNVFVRQQPNILYNAMLHPLIPYASRGLVWYQGEANSKQPAQYAQSLPAWIKYLRKAWGRDDFHLLAVMLPGFGDEAWSWFREVQMGLTKLSHASIANTIDLGDAKNIHPADKAPICERLALLARRDVYGEKVVAQGPLFKSVSINGATMVITFEEADGLKTTDGAAPTGFMLAGPDFVWRPAAAMIKGNRVELQADGVATPASVRYAFSGKPAVNLVNGVGLPAYPFRTDDEMK